MTFIYRAKDVDLVPYLTTHLVDDFASHIKLYRRALERVKAHQKDGSITSLIRSPFKQNYRPSKTIDFVGLPTVQFVVFYVHSASFRRLDIFVVSIDAPVDSAV